MMASGIKEWWVNDHNVTDILIEWATEMGIDLNNLSDQDKQMIALYWADYGK